MDVALDLELVVEVGLIYPNADVAVDNEIVKSCVGHGGPFFEPRVAHVRRLLACLRKLLRPLFIGEIPKQTEAGPAHFAQGNSWHKTGPKLSWRKCCRVA